jgi:hypothetical protein
VNVFTSALCEKKTRAKNESIHADRRKALWGRWKAKKSGRNSRFGVPSYRKGWPKMSQQKAKEEQPVKEGEKNDESTATAKYQQIR